MPKEMVSDMLGGEYAVVIGWERDGYVQLGTINPRRTYHVTYDGDSGAESFDANGFYATLDRDSINRLIRNLRRARDQAYGHDE